jgi:hypothetical protein
LTRTAGELTILTTPKPVRYRASVTALPDFHAANERSCDIGPPYRVSEELSNRTAVGLQHSFAKQVFAMPEMWKCSNNEGTAGAARGGSWVVRFFSCCYCRR